MKRTTWITLTLGVAALGVAVFIVPGRFSAWQQEHSLATTHITYSHFACAAQACPAYQVDVFGDGTVIYQGFQDVAVRGAYIYHIPRDSLQAYIRDFRVSGFWQKAHAGAPGEAGGGCRLTLTVDRHAHRAGCLDIKGEDGMTLGEPQLSADIAQLEALTRLDALVKGHVLADNSAAPGIAGMRPYARHGFP